MYHVPPDLLQCDWSMGLGNVLFGPIFQFWSIYPRAKALTFMMELFFSRVFNLWRDLFFFFNDMWLLECLPSIFGNHFSHPWGGFPGATFGHSWLRQSQIPYSQWTNQISALGSWSFGSMGPETGMLTNKVILMAAWRRRLMSLRTPRWWQISPLQNKNWVCLSSLE